MRKIIQLENGGVREFFLENDDIKVRRRKTKQKHLHFPSRKGTEDESRVSKSCSPL